MKLPSARLLFALTALGCAGLLGYGYYLEFARGLVPCPMCMMQRVCFMAAGLVSLAAALHGPGRIGSAVYGTVVVVFALLGAGVAARQVWLQHLPPDEVPECGPGLEFMLETWPLADVLRAALTGTGDCAEVDWRFLGLSIAEWSFVCFALMIAAHLAVQIAGRRNPGPSSPL